jgi:type II secretory pathway component PulF
MQGLDIGRVAGHQGLESFNSKEELVLGLGFILKCGTEMVSALKLAAESSEIRSVKIALLKAAKLIQEGNEPINVFKEGFMSPIPPYARFILGAPIDSKTKGEVLFHWHRFQFTQFKNFIELGLVLQEAAIGSLTLLSLFIFVVPQFEEIFMGLGIEGGFFFSILILLSHNMFGFLFLLIMGIFVIGVAGKSLLGKFLGIQSEIDYLNFLSLLKVLEKEKIGMIVRILSNKTIFPKEWEKFKHFSESLISGQSVDVALEESKIDTFFAWFIKLGLISDIGKSSIEDSAVLLEARIVTRFEMLSSLTGVFVTLFLGCAFGMVVIGVFSGILSAMNGAM